MQQVFTFLISTGWLRQPGAPQQTISCLSTDCARPLPQDYLDYLHWSNGGEGTIAGRYVSCWPAEEILDLNRDYEIPQHLPDCLAFATDGGSDAYLFDFRTHEPGVICVALGDLSYAEAVTVAPSFRRFLKP